MTKEVDKTQLHKKLHESMLLIRMVEEAIAERYSEWEMRCPTHLSIGQEGVAAAAGLALENDDKVVSTHRAHAHYLGKGGDLKAMISEIYGKETGCSGGYGGSMHLIDRSKGFVGSTALVGGSIPVGVGLGLAIAQQGLPNVSGIFLGDGAVEEGVFYESANFAALKKLPVLFICENNLYSVYSSLDVRQPEGRKIYEMVSALGLQTAKGDGNNIMESFEMIHDARKKILAGEGPIFLEFDTYRWREHCGPNYDNDIGYRTEDEFNTWKEKDPILHSENVLKTQHGVSSAWFDEKAKEITASIDDAFEFAKKAPFPQPESIYSKIFKPKETRSHG